MKIAIKDFFKYRYTNFAKYDNIRKIASFEDGLKLSARKILWTVYNLNITKEEKVTDLANIVSSKTVYIHGPITLEGVIVGLATSYNNNIPLLAEEGSFGNRTITTPSASRYIKSHKSIHFDSIIDKQVDLICEPQIFENKEIEPKYILTNLPLLLVNGSEALSVGFKQFILPRSVDSIKKYILGETKELKVSFPYYRGVVNRESLLQFSINGVLEKVNTTTIKITEIPIRYDLEKYKKDVLIPLLEDKIIEDYSDFSKENTFEFLIKTSRDFVKKDENELMKIFKLTSTLTETFTILKDNSIISYDSAEEYLDAWLKWRVEQSSKFLQLKINHKVKLYEECAQRIKFLNLIIDEQVTFKNKSSKEVKIELIELGIMEEYLSKFLQISIFSITKDGIETHTKELNKLKNEIKDLAKLDPTDFFIDQVKLI